MPADILKSDIFFVVTTVAVAALTIVAVIIGVYLIKILRETRALIKGMKWRYKAMGNFIKSIMTRFR